MLCLQTPATQVSIVQENSSSQSVEQDAEPLPPTVLIAVPPAPAAAESDGGVDSLVQAPEERMDAMAAMPINVCRWDILRRWLGKTGGTSKMFIGILSDGIGTQLTACSPLHFEGATQGGRGHGFQQAPPVQMSPARGQSAALRHSRQRAISVSQRKPKEQSLSDRHWLQPPLMQVHGATPQSAFAVQVLSV
jgi:hypothetical protein